MVLLLTLLSFFNSEQFLIQDSIQIITYYDNAYKGRVKKDYWVLTSDTTIKTGPYKEFFRNGTISISGLFRDGLHIGKWYFYDAQTNEPYLIYDYGTNEEIMYKPLNSEREANGGRTPYCPQFLPNSFSGFSEYLGLEIQNRNFGDRMDRDCSVRFSIVISESGKLEAGTSFSTCDDDLVAEIIAIIESSPNWYPMIINGVPARYPMSFPVTLKKMIQINSNESKKSGTL